MAVVQASRGSLPPASPHLLSEPAIVARLARYTLGDRTSVDWERLVANYDLIREHIAHHLKAGQFLMMTIRSHDQFNTSIYGLDDRYRGIHNGRRVVLLNKDDIRVTGLKEGQIVDLISHFEGEERFAHHFVVVPYDIPRGSAATYFPETNVLVPVRSVADKSNTPTYKSVVISIRPSAEGS
jgi:anaerobic selenocysteine-containing dehydrogenase